MERPGSTLKNLSFLVARLSSAFRLPSWRPIRRTVVICQQRRVTIPLSRSQRCQAVRGRWRGWPCFGERSTVVVVWPCRRRCFAPRPQSSVGTARTAWSADILSDVSRHRAAKVYRLMAKPGVCRKGAGPSGEARPALRSWHLGRRSGRTSALPYPPPKRNWLYCLGRCPATLHAFFDRRATTSRTTW